MSQLTFDPTWIDPKYKTNKVFTNTVQLAQDYKLQDLKKVINSTTDVFGSTKRQTHYEMPKSLSPEFESYCRALSQSLKEELNPTQYDIHFLTKRCEYWQPKNREDNLDYFNAVRFHITINNETRKVWVTIVLTANIGEDYINNLEDRKGAKLVKPTVSPFKDIDEPITRRKVVPQGEIDIDYEDVEVVTAAPRTRKELPQGE